MVKLVHLIPLYTIRLGLFLTLLIATILVIGSPLKLYASQSGVGFYSNYSPPVGMKSLEPLIGKWWNFWVDHPASYHETWP